MKFAMSALSVVVLLFAVSQANVIPTEQLNGDKVSDGVDSTTAASTSVSSAGSQPTEVSTDIIPTSSTTGVEADYDYDCLVAYTQSIVDLSSKKQAASNQMSDCVSEGNSCSVCDGKFGPTIKEINSNIIAVNQKFQTCLKQAMFQMISI